MTRGDLVGEELVHLGGRSSARERELGVESILDRSKDIGKKEEWRTYCAV